MTQQYVVGQKYHDAYWQRDFRVLAVDGLQVTVQWQDGRIVTHMTALDARDKPFATRCTALHHGDALKNHKTGWGMTVPEDVDLQHPLNRMTDVCCEECGLQMYWADRGMRVHIVGNPVCTAWLEQEEVEST